MARCTPGMKRRPAGGARWRVPLFGVVAAGLVAALLTTPALAQGLTTGMVLPAGLGLFGLAALVVASAWGFAAELGLRRDLWLLRRRLERLAHPVWITRTGGRVEWLNAAARSMGAGPDTRLADILERGGTGSEAVVFRLARLARRNGFAWEYVGVEGDGQPGVLTARVHEPDRLIWMLVPAGSGEAEGGVSLGVGDGSGVPVLRRGDDGGLVANHAFRSIFSSAASKDSLAAALEDLEPGTMRRVLLDDREGRPRLCQVYAVPAEAGCEGTFAVLPLAEGAGEPEVATILQVLPVALMELDTDGRVLWCNGPAREMLGSDVPAGTPLAELIEPLGRPMSVVLAEAASARSRRREMVRPRLGAPETFLHVSLTPVARDGAPRLLAVLTDASEIRLLEDKFAQSQKMEAVGKLAGGVAHDFNNVLTAISGHADLLLLGKDARHPDYSDLMQIRQNTLRATALVRQLLAFSRKQRLEPTLVSVQDVVADTQYLLDRLIGERVTLTLEHGRDVRQVRADRQQLEQVLMNLVVNARDAMPEGGVITISTARRVIPDGIETRSVEVPAGAYVEICVSDEGTGIDEPLLDRIFEPFFTTKAQGEGTGLGLSTVYGIVKQSGGYIFAENRPEGGARFRILLPEAGPEEEAEDVRAAEPERRDLTGRGGILLVEDEDPVRSFASRALRLRGYEVFEAASAEEAMAVLSDPEVRIDLLVSDVVMPGMDGPSFAMEARRQRPDLKVIFISGYAEDSFRRSGFTGEFLFLPKPFSLTELTARVKEALERPAVVEEP